MDTFNSGLFIEDDRLYAFAASEARLMPAVGVSRGAAFTAELTKDYRLIKRCHEAVERRYGDMAAPPAACEWLLDNWYMVRREYLSACAALKNTGPLRRCEGGALIVALSEALLAAGKGSVTEQRCGIFLRGFQSVTPLTQEELGIFPAALRCAVIARLAGVCAAMQYAADTAAHAEAFSALFGTLRALQNSSLDELLSDVDLCSAILAQDPTGDYAKMDSETKREYLRRLSVLARRQGLEEHVLAKRLIKQAQRDKKHIGFYLFPELPQWRSTVYICADLLLSLFFTLYAAFYFENIWAALLLLLPLMTLIKALTDFILMHLSHPRRVPRMDFSDGVGEDARTICVISTLLGTADAERLEELRLLSRREGRSLCFGLLADLPTSKTETAPEDSELLSRARACIDALNRKYGGGFYLFTRRRSFDGESYCGRERKRGAVMELAALLCDGESELEVFGERDFLRGIRYIITLDSDTKVYPGALGELIGAAAHPLCRPVIDEKTRVVRSGHAILHPRLTVELESATATDFSLIYAGSGGSDPYSGVGAELYMDVFGSGGFSGKGIIDAAALLRCLGGRLPEGRVLSHDALEGAYLRGGYVGDVCFSDAFPTRPLAYFKRAHRWIRGDWQNLTWIFSRELTALDRFRLFDNLRRSLAPPLTLAALLTGFFSRAGGIRLAAAAALLALLSELILGLAELGMARSAPFHLRRYTRLLTGVGGSIVKCFMNLWLLPYEAWLNMSAVVTALWRMLVSKKRLLQWQTAAQTERSAHDLAAHIRAMCFPIILGAALMALSPEIIGKTAGFMWLVSPIAAYALSLSAYKESALGRADREYIVRAAAENWKYLEKFSSAEDNFLPPDNYQEQPPTGIAHRTSPTNIGLACSAAVAAAEMGIITRNKAAEYISRVVKTLYEMPRALGHFFNWYDTRTLSPLKPAYISTVDSGNLYAGLLCAKNALMLWGFGDTARRIDVLLRAMDFSPLYDKQRGLFHICYDTVNRRGIGGRYDLMASEARLTSYLAAAKGDVPIKHWRMLSRAQLQKDGFQGLASWSGTMFEYMMPELFLPLYRSSLLYESARFCLYVQKRRRFTGKPWGISESAFYSLDAGLSYRYKAHGCPELALKRGQERDMVVSPYSSFLALAVDPIGSVRNLRRLEACGAQGRFGFIEALDFTPSRCRRSDGEAVRCYMAHHVGMSIIASANAVCDGIMQKHFMSSPDMRAYTMLLQEKLPPQAMLLRRDSSPIPERPGKYSAEQWSLRGGEEEQEAHCCVLSNGVYNIMSTNHGCTSASLGSVCVYRGSPELAGLELRLNGSPLLPCAAPGAWMLSEEQLRLSMRQSDISCSMILNVSGECCGELRSFELSSPRAQMVELELSFLPILAEMNNYVNHPAYWQLGLEQSIVDGKLLIRRLSKGNSPELWLCLKCSREAKLALCNADGENVSAPRVSARLTLPLSPDSAEKLGFALCVGFDPSDVLSGADRILTCGALVSGCMVSSAAAHLGMSAAETGEAMKLLLPLWENRLCAAAPRSELWQFGISGDLPLICCDGRAAEADRLLRAFCLLKSCGVEAELVYLSAEHGEYVQPLMQRVSKTLSSLGLEALIGSRGGVYIVPNDSAEIILSRAAVRIGDSRSLPPALQFPALSAPRRVSSVPEYKWEDQRFIYYVNQSLPSRAWQHILTNGRFGCALSDCGCGFMWYDNAREMRINMPPESVRDVSGSEQIYLEYGGERVSIFAANDGCPCRVEYAPGVAAWTKELFSREIRASVFIPSGIDARIIRISGAEGLKLRWLLRPLLSPQDSAAVKISVQDGSVAIENPESFIPNTVFRMRASGPCDAETDFCPAAVRLTTICDRETLLVCGCCGENELAALCQNDIQPLLDNVRERWAAMLGRFRLSSGSAPLDAYMNTWCVYQCIACRLDARTSLYQSGGAFGFRDQLQDSVNMLLISPDYARRQIRACCAHQYVEGDVMHWWHCSPRGDRGVRTRCGDDLLWLCWALGEYCRATGDYAICHEQIEYIGSARLTDHEHDRYETAQPSGAYASVIDHAKAALECCITRGFGEHGLPWFGSGDWNDALDRVGGESVWLGWFFAHCADELALLLERLGLTGAERYRRYAAQVGAAADSAYADGRYLRGWYSDGEALGGEAQIDSLTQSWAAMSRYADLSKVDAALNLALCKLVDREHRIVKLFDPPYSADGRSPGYITGYGMGVRENGGQYTHGAIWLAIAALRRGRTDEGCAILRMLLPSGHDMRRYEAEPFVLAADVSSMPGVEGQAGWTWYTGSAGWYFRAVTEELLGLRLRGGKLYIEPRLPSALPAYRAVWRDNNGTEHLIDCRRDGIFVDREPYKGEGIG